MINTTTANVLKKTKSSKVTWKSSPPFSEVNYFALAEVQRWRNLGERQRQLASLKITTTTIHNYISWHQFLTFITLNRTSWPRLSWPLKNSCSGYVRAMSLRMSFSHGDDIFSSSEYWFFTGISVALPSSCHTMARKWWGMPFLMSSWGAERGGDAEGDQYLVLAQWGPNISQRAGSSGSDERSQL